MLIEVNDMILIVGVATFVVLYTLLHICFNFSFSKNPKIEKLAQNSEILIVEILIFYLIYILTMLVIFWLVLYFGFEIPNPKAIWISIGIFFIVLFIKKPIIRQYRTK